MPEIIDARGLKCPEPAIRTGRALKEHDNITVIVDDEEAVTNISRGVIKRGYDVQVERKEGDNIQYFFKLNKTRLINLFCIPKPCWRQRKSSVFRTHNRE